MLLNKTASTPLAAWMRFFTTMTNLVSCPLAEPVMTRRAMIQAAVIEPADLTRGLSYFVFWRAEEQ